MPTIAIIGSGFTGTMVAVHLMRMRELPPLRIVLIERSGVFTAGVAYGTRFSCHLLNVPAGRMSAFENEQDHFLRWARANGEDGASITGGTFVQRRLYGRYLADVLNQTQSQTKTNCELVRQPGEATAVRIQPDGSAVVDVSGGEAIRADRVLLAIGNFPPSDPPVANMQFYQSDLYARDPWSPTALDVDADQPVMLLGTGLTMIDMAMALHEGGHRGPILAVSRRGLLPQPHRDSPTPPPTHDRPKDLDRWQRTARGLLRAIRNEVKTAAQQGVDWREVITSLRADTPRLWQSLNATERARFLTHLRPFWETHRHRAAPRIAAQIDAMIESGQLKVIAGRVMEYREKAGRVDVVLRCRGSGCEKTVGVNKVINCTGPDTNLARVNEPLIQCLRRSGLIRPDALGLGLDTDQTGALLNAQGKPSGILFLAGPLRKGQLWENTAVPELRIEAAMMACRLAAGLISH